MKKYSLWLALLVGCTCAVSVHARTATPQWTEREREKAVSSEGDFLVVKYDSGCTVKQSYADPGMMELAYSAGEMHILSPFYKGVETDVEYWVDDKKKRSFSKETVNRTNDFPRLSDAVIESMTNGGTLYVKVNPVDAQPRIQEFNLRGLSDAIQVVEGEECAPKSEARSEDLQVRLSREDGGIVVHGTTTLPQGLKLLISVFDETGTPVGSRKTAVGESKYRTDVVRPESAGTLSGEYTIEISSPAWGLQPDHVARELDDGNGLPEEIREKSFGQFVVDYTVIREAH